MNSSTTEKPKIAMVATEMLPVPPIRGGAIQTYIEGVVHLLAKSFDMTVVSVGDEALQPEVESGGVRYVRIGKPNQKSHYYREVARFLASERWDLVEIFNRPAVVSELAKSIGSARLVLSVHNEMFHQKKIASEEAEACLERLDAVVTISRFIRKRILKLYPDFKPKISPILSGVDLDSFKPRWLCSDAEIAEARWNTGIEADGPLILSVARLSEKKGVHLLVPAMEAVLKQHPTARLVLVGSRWYGDNREHPYVDRINALIEPFGDAITMTGYVPYHRVADYFRLADIFVCASQWREPLARVHYEAMAAGLPIITTNRGGNLEVVRPGETGLVAQPYDEPRSFADAMLELIGDPERAREMGRRNRSLAEDHHSWNSVSKKLRKVFLKVLGGQTPAT